MKGNVEKALNELEEEAKWCHNDGETLTKYDEERFNVIRQALLNEQDLEKFTRLVIKKCVKIQLVCVVGEVEQYNQTYVYDNMLNVKWCLTEDEFNFAKEMIEKYED